jgi:hypothetical protein
MNRGYLLVHCYPRSDLWCLYFSFALMQKKQKIKENPPVGGQAPIAPRVFPGLRAAKAGG